MEAIKKFNPDIVFADIKLSDVSGIDMINKGKNYCDFTCIVVAQREETCYIQKILNLPRQCFVTKSINGKELEKKVFLLDREKRLNVFSLKDYLNKYIEKNYENQIRTADLAEKLYVSEVYLRHKIKEITGENFTTLLNKYRVKKAMELIEQGYKKTHIAGMVGYNDYKVLGKNIKKYKDEIAN